MFCCIASNVNTLLYTHPTNKFVSIHPAFFSSKKQCGFTYVDQESFQENLGGIIVGNDVWIGSHVIIRER